jgi:phosphoglycolate phosphatase
MLRESGYDFNENKSLATALYYGLYTDSNGMSEISHPADRDLRDFAVYDKELIMQLTNSVLTLSELKIAAEALNNVVNDDVYHFAVTCAEECDPNILGYINDLILQVDTVDVSIVCCFISGGVKISVRSCISDIKAQELAKYITDTIGSGGGQNQKAGGFISLLSAPGINSENIFSFITGRVKKYYRSFDVIRSEDFSADPVMMDVYVKKPQLLGYVVSTDIFEPGTLFRVRSLEADFEVTAADDLYILVDRYGSAYPSEREKFEKTYEPCSEEFTIMSDYKPHAISYDMHSRKLVFSCCRTRNGSRVYAYCLTRNTKLYTGWSKQSYTSGKAGDYLVMRMDDTKDMYIIGKERFGEIYQIDK